MIGNKKNTIRTALIASAAIISLTLIPTAFAEMKIPTDQVSVETGKRLYAKRCKGCHDPESTRTIERPGVKTGPGHKGVMKTPTLPLSNKAATPENIRTQIRKPFKDMPAFSEMPDDDVLNIIAYMNTL